MIQKRQIVTRSCPVHRPYFIFLETERKAIDNLNLNPFFVCKILKYSYLKVMDKLSAESPNDGQENKDTTAASIIISSNVEVNILK